MPDEDSNEQLIQPYLFSEEEDDMEDLSLDESRIPSPPPSFWRRNVDLFKGLFFAFMSGVLLSLTSVTVKLLSDISPGELSCYRFLAIAVYILPLVVYDRHKIWNRAFLGLFAARAVFESGSIFFRYYCVQTLPLAEANVIIFSSPVFVAIFARIFLKEKCSLVTVISLITTMLGLLLVMKIPAMLIAGDKVADLTDPTRLAGTLYGLASVFFNSMCYIFIRKIKDVHHTIIIFYLGWMSGIGSGIIAAFVDGFAYNIQCNYEAGVLLALGLLSIFGQLFLTKALQLEQAGPISIVRSGSDIVLAFIWQIIFFGERADGYSISGAILVTIGGVMLNFRKWLLSQPENSPTRQRFQILTM